MYHIARPPVPRADSRRNRLAQNVREIAHTTCVSGRSRKTRTAWAPPGVTNTRSVPRRVSGALSSLAKEENGMLGAIIAWIIVGAIAGWLASLVVRGTGLGLGGDIIVGIIGGIIGGIILQLLFGTGGVSGFNIGSIITAFIGAVILLLIVRLFTGNRTTARV